MNTSKEYQSALQPRRQSNRTSQQPTSKLFSVKSKKTSQLPTSQLPLAESTNTTSFKKGIKKAINKVSQLIGYKKNKESMSVYETVAVEQHISDLKILEEETIKKVDEVKITEETQNQPQNDIPPLLGEIYDNLMKGINDIISSNERTTKIIDTINRIEQTTTTKQPINRAKQVDYLQMLNEILKCLENNFINKSKKKELSFTILSDGHHNIKVNSIGITITYRTFREFVDNIKKRFDMIISLCKIPFSNCPDNIMPLIKNFIDNYDTKNDDILCDNLKEIISAFLKYEQEKKGRMYLDTKTQKLTNKIPEELINLLQIQTNGGRKKRNPKNIKNKKIIRKYYH